MRALVKGYTDFYFYTLIVGWNVRYFVSPHKFIWCFLFQKFIRYWDNHFEDEMTLKSGLINLLFNYLFLQFIYLFGNTVIVIKIKIKTNKIEKKN